MPAEMLPAKLDVNGVEFQLAPAGARQADAVTAKGQAIDLPAGNFNRVYLLAALGSAATRRHSFQVGEHAVELNIEDWGGFIGQWDTRLWKPRPDLTAMGGGEFQRTR